MKEFFEGWSWLFVAVASVLAVYLVAPAQVSLMVYTMAKISIGAFVGLMIDKSIFKLAKPKDLVSEPVAFRSACNRRALIIAATILASAIGI